MGSRQGGSGGGSGREEDDASGFTPQQQQTLQRMMDEMVRRLTNPQGLPPNPPEQQQQHIQPPVIYGSTHIKPAEIGYFYPDMPSSWGTGGTVDRDEKTYYRTVWAFTNRLKVLASTRDTGQLARAIENCLKGEAEKWWNNEISNVQRIGLVHDPTGVNEWCAILEARFKQPPSEALQTLHNLRCTTQDARNRKSPTTYVSEIVVAAQACGQGDNEYALVLHAWSRIDIELRENIDEPTADMMIAKFMDILRRRQIN